MILNINGGLNRYYAQTLCLLFFPGATFGENEEREVGKPEITFDVDEGQDEVTTTVTIQIDDEVGCATETVRREECSRCAAIEKISAGRAFFGVAKRMLGYTPPWGILTGVRPAKIAASYLADGYGIMQTKRILRDEYFTNPKKAQLAVNVASNEIKLLKKQPKGLCSMYISIPFCPSRCAYCSFVSYTSPKLLSLIDDYLDALILDMENMVRVIREQGFSLATVYIGGGTPTVLDERQLTRLLDAVRDNVDVSALREFTLESGRPDTITEEKLRIAREHGVTRVSVNPQTMSDEILKNIGRNHTTEDFLYAYDMAKRSGIRDVNVDLIAGLPGDNYKNFSKTLDKIIELDPSNLTVHTFAVKKASEALKRDSNIYLPQSDDTAKCVEYSQLRTKIAGYRPYYMYKQKNTIGNLENVGYSKEGHECLYNIYMMEEVHSVFSVGAGAVTKLIGKDSDGKFKLERIFSPKYPYEYLRDARELREGGESHEPLALRIEKFFAECEKV